MRGEIDAVAAASSSGSTLKPFLYALALERGYTAASLLPGWRAYRVSLADGLSPRG